MDKIFVQDRLLLQDKLGASSSGVEEPVEFTTLDGV